MVTLLEFRKLEDAFNKEVNKYKEVKNTETAQLCESKVIKSQEEFNAHRDLMAGRIKSATQLYKLQTEVKRSLIKLGSVSSYTNIYCKCSSCGEWYTSLENLYADFDFRTGLCDECKSDVDNKDTADLIKKGKKLTGIFDDCNNLIELRFESDGKQYNVFNERKDGYKNELTLERE